MPISDFYSSIFYDRSRGAADPGDKPKPRGKANKPPRRSADAPARSGPGSEYMP